MGVQAVYDQQTQLAERDFQGQVRIEAVHDSDKTTREELLNDAVLNRSDTTLLKLEGVRLVEMAVLSGQQAGRALRNMLNHGITPQTEDSLHIGRHPSTLAVVALSRWVLDPNEERHATAWLQCMAAMEPDRIQESRVLCLGEWQESADGKRFKTFHAASMMDHLFPELKPFERAHGPGVVDWACLRCAGVTGRFDAYAEALMELAKDVTGTEEGGLRGFEASIGLGTAGRSWQAEADAVQVMTVHKPRDWRFRHHVVAGDNPAREVKGHVPVVLGKTSGTALPAALLKVTDMKDTVLDDEAEAELDAALLDQMNIVYVAMTRPVERLTSWRRLQKWTLNGTSLGP